MGRLFITACLAACATTPRKPASPPVVASYLVAVKTAVGRAWTSRVIDAAHRNDPSGCLYSTRDRRTVLVFTLDTDGQLSNVRIKVSCGVQYLDDVAVESIKSVEKLDRPPPELMGSAPFRDLPFALTLQARKRPEQCPP